MKCPKCQEGDFFISHPYNLKRIGDIHQKCSSCNEKYTKEPGFYFGAMFISYGITVGMFLAIWSAFVIFYQSYTPFHLVITFVITVILLCPYLYALSKIIWANLFIKYDAEKAKIV